MHSDFANHSLKASSQSPLHFCSWPKRFFTEYICPLVAFAIVHDAGSEGLVETLPDGVLEPAIRRLLMDQLCLCLNARTFP